MHSKDSSSDSENQFAIDASAFISDLLPGTGIRLLRPRPESERALASQLDIARRLELLRRQAPPSSNTPRLLQDVAAVGQTSRGEVVYLVLSVLVERSEWVGSWFIAIVPPNETEAWQAYLAATRERIVLEARVCGRRP
jgi:hypothetical protein